MRVRVLFFGMLRELAGRASDELELPGETPVAALLAACFARFPEMRGMTSSLAVAVNQEYSGAGTLLKDGDEVALLPPVSGGAFTETAQAEDTEAPHHSSLAAECHCALLRQPIHVDAVLARLEQPEDGAIAIFAGTVRNHSRGRRTLFLEYEAYEPMALAQMKALVAEAQQKFRIRQSAIEHRLGRLEIGETSVLIAVASAHRAPAMEACRWLIDTLKLKVPIWKKEHFEDGAVWTAGEPFPAEVMATAPPGGTP